MFRKIGEWIAVVLIAAAIVGFFMFFGIILVPFILLGLGGLAILVGLSWLSSLFRRSEATTGRREEKD